MTDAYSSEADSSTVDVDSAVELMGPDEKGLKISFSGAGFHGYWFNGICEYIKRQKYKIYKVYGMYRVFSRQGM